MPGCLPRLPGVKSHCGMGIVLKTSMLLHPQEVLFCFQNKQTQCTCVWCLAATCSVWPPVAEKPHVDQQMQCIAHSNSIRKHACNAGKDVEADKKQKIQILAILVRISGLTGTASALSPLSQSAIQCMSHICFAL